MRRALLSLFVLVASACDCDGPPPPPVAPKEVVAPAPIIDSGTPDVVDAGVEEADSGTEVEEEPHHNPKPPMKPMPGLNRRRHHGGM